MITVGNRVEGNVFDMMIPPVTIPQNVSTTVLPDVSRNFQEIAYREIFNSGLNNVYYAFGRDCDNITNYNAYLVPGQMLEVATLQKVNCFCTAAAGSTISITVLKRDNLVQPGANIL